MRQQQHSATATGSAVAVPQDSARSRWAGATLLRLARDLTAKRAVERHLKRRARGGGRQEGAPFQNLSCCIETHQLQERLVQVEQEIRRLRLEHKNISHLRNAELDQRNGEIADLQQQLLRRISDRSSRVARPQDQSLNLEVESTRLRIDADCLTRKLMSQRCAMELAQEERLQAKREAEESEAKLADLHATHTVEMTDLRRQLSSTTLVASTPSQGELEGQYKAMQTQPNCQQAMPRDLAATEAGSWDLDVSDRELFKQCVALHGPASQFVFAVSRMELPPAPDYSGKDPTYYTTWLRDLAFYMTQIGEELTTPEGEPEP